MSEKDRDRRIQRRSGRVIQPIRPRRSKQNSLGPQKSKSATPSQTYSGLSNSQLRNRAADIKKVAKSIEIPASKIREGKYPRKNLESIQKLWIRYKLVNNIKPINIRINEAIVGILDVDDRRKVLSEFVPIEGGKLKAWVYVIFGFRSPLLKNLERSYRFFMDIHEKLCTIIEERKILKEKSLNNQALVQNFNNFEHADSINVGLAIQNSKFKMLWEQNSRSIDIQSLEEDLRNLLVELKRISQNNDCIEDIVKIAKACELAKHNNGAGALERLSGVNEWVLDFAKNIGSNVAATAISKSLGIV